VILIITALVIIIYTYETYKLREVNEEDVLLKQIPSITFDFHNDLGLEFHFKLMNQSNNLNFSLVKVHFDLYINNKSIKLKQDYNLLPFNGYDGKNFWYLRSVDQYKSGHFNLLLSFIEILKKEMKLRSKEHTEQIEELVENIKMKKQLIFTYDVQIKILNDSLKEKNIQNYQTGQLEKIDEEIKSLYSTLTKIQQIREKEIISIITSIIQILNQDECSESVENIKLRYNIQIVTLTYIFSKNIYYCRYYKPEKWDYDILKNRFIANVIEAEPFKIKKKLPDWVEESLKLNKIDQNLVKLV